MIGRKIATVVFWTIATCLAAMFAWLSYLFYPDLTSPWLLSAVVVFCAVTALGLRECIRAVRGNQISSSKVATLTFWLGVLGFFALAGIFAWRVLPN
jgi:hypothetical protein